MKLIAVDTILDAIKIVNQDNDKDVVFIKTSDLKDWVKNKNIFTNKSFGDKQSGLVVNFIYKENDPDLEKQNLSEELKKFILLKNLSK